MRNLSYKEDKILDSAKILFLTNDYANVMLKDIADKAGVEISIVRFYFYNKFFLYKKVFEKVVSEFKQKAKEIITPDLSIPETIKKIIDTHFKIFLENPRVLVFILSYFQGHNRGMKSLFLTDKMYNLEFYTKLFSEKLKKKITVQFELSDFINMLLSLITYSIMVGLNSTKHNLYDASFKEFMSHKKNEILDFMCLSTNNEKINPVFFTICRYHKLHSKKMIV